ncbi:MAG: hypothetical protein IPI30_22735 [Saprospiraceae bacterium]|nr:hypothetical protein [Candidatus Vicinibacter affinis]
MSNTDAFPDDRARIMIENALTATSSTDVLTTGGGSFIQGSRTLNVSAGDRICFEVNSDNLGGVDSLTISNLTLEALGAPSITVVGPRPGEDLSCGTYFGAFYRQIALTSILYVNFKLLSVTLPNQYLQAVQMTFNCNWNHRIVVLW